jgi:hypothetical protein
MKLLCLIFTVSIISISIAEAEIKNGYVDIINARKSLRSLLEIVPSTDLKLQRSNVLNDRIRMLKDYIACFELTEILLQQFRLIAPELYNEIDSIRDKSHRSTDVFIKFIPKEHADIQLPGTTYMQYKAGDHASYSEYGERTVSVKIWIMDTSLTILAHELGHVKHVVPNLASYDEYYKQNYRSLNDDPDYLGHNPNDPGGKSASFFEKRFIDDYRIYLRTYLAKLSSPFKLIRDIRRNRNVVDLITFPIPVIFCSAVLILIIQTIVIMLVGGFQCCFVWC